MTAPCFAQAMRLIWIDAFLAAGHALNRADLVQAFGISVPQASLDLAEFRRRWPWRLAYLADRKVYRAAAPDAVFPAPLRAQVLACAAAVKRARCTVMGSA